jgi:hypothetical protein
MLLGTALLVTQVSQPLVLDDSAEIEQADENDSHDADAPHWVVATDLAINTISQVDLHQELYQIREIILDEVADPHIIHPAQKLSDSDHFRTLFRNVISTNAP